MGTRREISSLISGVPEKRSQGRHLGPGPAGNLSEHLPLRARLFYPRAGDLGAEDDTAFGRGLGHAAFHLVTGLGGQEHDGVSRVDQHLSRQDDVEVDAATGHVGGPGARKPAPAALR